MGDSSLIKKTLLVCAALAGTHLSAASALAAAATASTPAEAPLKVAVRRVTETQYRNIIADNFGSEIKISARFEPEKREDGLFAIGTAQLSLTTSGFEQYFGMATTIAEQALSDKQRATTVSCKPADATKPDNACAKQFIEKYGQRLFRRPLTAAESQARVQTAATGATQAQDFYAGLKLALTSLLAAPEFLFRVETAEIDPANPKQHRLDAYTKASRISFMLWDTAPDDELLATAASGAIHNDAVLKQQLARLTASPRYEQGARAFFADMLQLDGFDNLVKDPAIYPKFNQSVADSAKEETLKSTVDLLINKKRDYRELFTTTETIINRPLASVYNVPYLSQSEWAPYKFAASSERAGILTQVSFLSLFAHPGTSSPTRRGIKVWEIFMCTPTPDPPADVDFSKVTDSKSGTVRGRLLDHMENTGCTTCHKRSDPPGLALEHFDGLGQYRAVENGAPVDVSAEFDGVKFTGAQGMANWLRNSPKVSECLVRNVYAYGVGRKTGIRDEEYLADQTKAFTANGYKVPDLMMQIASSPEFFKVTVPAGARTAAVESAPQQQTAHQTTKTVAKN
jgi:hypothetical protein